jgi:predicted nucleic acid-binding protein
MEEKYLIDTNVLIDAQMKNLPEKGIQFLAEVINKDFIVSFITFIEFLGYKEATKATEDFIALAEVIEINKVIIQTCINLRKTKIIKLPDAIIAATAMAHNFTLVTRDANDFKNISGIKLINPWEL